MGITDIPASFDEFQSWASAYERDQFRFAETNQRIGSATRDLFASWVPRILSPLVRYGIYAMLDQKILDSFGFPRPLPLMRSLLAAILRARGRVVRCLPPRRVPHFFTDGKVRTYPRGYDIASLGPPRLVARERNEAAPHK